MRLYIQLTAVSEEVYRSLLVLIGKFHHDQSSVAALPVKLEEQVQGLILSKSGIQLSQSFN